MIWSAINTEISQEVRPREEILQHHDSIAPGFFKERFLSRGKGDESGAACAWFRKLGSFCGHAVLSTGRCAVIERNRRRTDQLRRSTGAVRHKSAEAFNAVVCKWTSSMGIVPECVLSDIGAVPSRVRIQNEIPPQESFAEY